VAVQHGGAVPLLAAAFAVMAFEAHEALASA
jgi:hypothetical protein